MRLRFNVFGTTSPIYLGIQGRLQKIHYKVEKEIKDFLDKYPTIRLNEVGDFLTNKYDIKASLSTIS